MYEYPIKIINVKFHKIIAYLLPTPLIITFISFEYFKIFLLSSAITLSIPSNGKKVEKRMKNVQNYLTITG